VLLMQRVRAVLSLETAALLSGDGGNVDAPSIIRLNCGCCETVEFS
jgi:hypothetical protein